MSEFDYSKIPIGYYDHVIKGPDGIRKFWHYHKFESVLRILPAGSFGPEKSLLDVGCFCGSFLGMIPQELFGYQVGVDLLVEQVNYAQSVYGTSHRRFNAYSIQDGIESILDQKFDVITLIEVIEHIQPLQVKHLINVLEQHLEPGGFLIITTPNYMSIWPLLEKILNAVSEVSYEEQHVTKFNYLNFEPKLKALTNTNLELLNKTTTHFLTPFLASISYDFALKLSQSVPSSKWHNPFGNIILSSWRKS